jgi:collagenase-like PrtC family protease
MDDIIYFYIPEFVKLFHVNMTLLERMSQCPAHYRENIKIGAIYGCFPGTIWNGGRVSLGLMPQTDMTRCINFHKEIEMPLRFTWTNIALEEKHFMDPLCNWVTKEAEDGINEILVNDPKLEAYIREHYPQYPLISSTTKCLSNIEAVNAELEKDYKLVVLDYGFNNDWEKLEQINHHEKCEILVNPACNPHCPFRAQHYLALSKNQLDPSIDGDGEVKDCPTFNRRFCEIQELPTFISWKAIETEYIPRGFRHFKIEGRTAHPLLIMETYLHYFAKEEFRDIEREHLYDGALRQLGLSFHNARQE